MCSESPKRWRISALWQERCVPLVFGRACASGTNTLASPATFARTDHFNGHSEVLCYPRAQLSTALIGLALRGPSFAARGVTLTPQHSSAPNVMDRDGALLGTLRELLEQLLPPNEPDAPPADEPREE